MFVCDHCGALIDLGQTEIDCPNGCYGRCDKCGTLIESHRGLTKYDCPNGCYEGGNENG